MPTQPPYPGRGRTGRPRNPEQVVASAISAPLVRTRTTFDVPSCTLAEFRGYVAWVGATWNLPEPEARVAALDSALRRLMTMDPVWKKHLAAVRGASAPSSSKPGPKSAPPDDPPLLEDVPDFDEPTCITKPGGE